MIKYYLNAKRNLVTMVVHLELQPQTYDKWTHLSPTCHTLLKDEKKKAFISAYKKSKYYKNILQI